MSETHNADGVNPADGQDLDPIIPDGDKPQTVLFSTYDKAMSSKAKEKAGRLAETERANAAESKLKELEEQKMLESGQYKELAAQKDKELKELREANLQERKERIVAEAKAIMTEVANKFGAYSADDIHKNIALKDVAGPDGKVDPVLVAAKVEELKRTKQYLFKATSAKIVDGAPQVGVSSAVSVNKLDTSKLAELYRKNALANN